MKKYERKENPKKLQEAAQKNMWDAEKPDVTWQNWNRQNVNTKLLLRGLFLLFNHDRRLVKNKPQP